MIRAAVPVETSGWEVEGWVGGSVGGRDLELVGWRRESGGAGGGGVGNRTRHGIPIPDWDYGCTFVQGIREFRLGVRESGGNGESHPPHYLMKSAPKCTIIKMGPRVSLSKMTQNRARFSPKLGPKYRFPFTPPPTQPIKGIWSQFGCGFSTNCVGPLPGGTPFLPPGQALFWAPGYPQASLNLLNPQIRPKVFRLPQRWPK
jgi:hypothetical protein